MPNYDTNVHIYVLWLEQSFNSMFIFYLWTATYEQLRPDKSSWGQQKQ